MNKINTGYLFLCLIAASCHPGGSSVREESSNRPDESAPDVVIYPAPSNEPLNTRYKVTANGADVPVYDVKIAPGANSRADTFEIAGMAYFDMKKAPVAVGVIVDAPISKADISPDTAAILSEIDGNRLLFKVNQPCHLSIRINDDHRPLYLFVNPEESDIPDPKAPEVVYFGPGSYRLPAMELEDGMTVYVAGGSVVHCYVGPHEWYTVNSFGHKNYDKFYTFDLTGKHITFRGRGIIDMDAIPTHGRRSVRMQGENILLEGVIFRNPSDWTVWVENSRNVSINNIKILGYRTGSDGVNAHSSQSVRIENTYIVKP
jgi:hypothetical protein